MLTDVDPLAVTSSEEVVETDVVVLAVCEADSDNVPVIVADLLRVVLADSETSLESESESVRDWETSKDSEADGVSETDADVLRDTSPVVE